MTLGQRLNRHTGLFCLPEVIGQSGENLFTLHPIYLSRAGERHNEGSAVRNLTGTGRGMAASGVNVLAWPVTKDVVFPASGRRRVHQRPGVLG